MGGGTSTPFEYKEIILDEDSETLTVTFDNELPSAFAVMVATMDYVDDIGTTYYQHRTIANYGGCSNNFRSSNVLTPVLASNGNVSRWDNSGCIIVDRATNSVSFASDSAQIFKSGWKYYAIIY